MSRFIILFILYFSLNVSGSSLSADNYRIKRQITTTPKPIQCDKQPYDTMLKDCTTDGLQFKLFNHSQLLACNNNKNDTKLFDFMRTYILHKFMTSTQSTGMDFFTGNNEKEITTAICFSDCLFKNFGIEIDPVTNVGGWQGSLINFFNSYIRPVGPKWELMFETANVCMMSVAGFPIRTVQTSTGKVCKALNFFATQCMYKRMLQNLPRLGTYKNTTACNAGVENLKTVCSAISIAGEY